MGYGALIGGIISAVGSTAGSLLSSSGAGQTNALATQEGHAINVARNKYLSPFLNPNFWNLDIPGKMQQQQQLGQRFAGQENIFNQAQLTNMLNQVMPGYQGMFGQMGANVASELAGNVPVDVQNQIQRFGAQQAITSGIGGGGGAGVAGAPSALTGRTITARDLGLTSLQLEQQGQAGLGSMFAMARNYLMPQLATPQSMLPLSDLIGAQQWTDQAIYEANLAAYNASVASAVASTTGQVPTQSPVAGITGGIGGMLQGLGQTNPQTGQTGYGMLGGGFSRLGSYFGSASNNPAWSGSSFGEIAGTFAGTI